MTCAEIGNFKANKEFATVDCCCKTERVAALESSQHVAIFLLILEAVNVQTSFGRSAERQLEFYFTISVPGPFDLSSFFVSLLA